MENGLESGTPEAAPVGGAQAAPAAPVLGPGGERPDQGSEQATPAEKPEQAAQPEKGGDEHTLELDTAVPGFELSGLLANAPDALKAEILKQVNAYAQGKLAAKAKDMQRGFTKKTTELAELRKQIESQAAQRPGDDVLQAAQAYQRILDDPAELIRLADQLRGGTAQAQPAKGPQDDLAARIKSKASEAFGDEAGAALGDLLLEVVRSASSPETEGLAKEVKALKDDRERELVMAAQAEQVRAFQGWQKDWDTKWGLEPGTCAGLSDEFVKVAKDNQVGSRLLTLGLLAERGQLPLSMISEKTKAAIIAADQERIKKATQTGTPAQIAGGAAPGGVPTSPRWDSKAPPGGNLQAARAMLAARRARG